MSAAFRKHSADYIRVNCNRNLLEYNIVLVLGIDHPSAPEVTKFPKDIYHLRWLHGVITYSIVLGALCYTLKASF